MSDALAPLLKVPNWTTPVQYYSVSLLNCFVENKKQTVKNLIWDINCLPVSNSECTQACSSIFLFVCPTL